jgi:hypothetical protein
MAYAIFCSLLALRQSFSATYGSPRNPIPLQHVRSDVRTGVLLGENSTFGFAAYGVQAEAGEFLADGEAG